MWKIMISEGFFADLQPIGGAIKAVKKMASSGFDVYFCSAPLIQNPYCASEKCAWIKGHFGRTWERKLILAPDKTLVHGDFLIDDRPEIKGKHRASWEHILYDQPYNRDVPGLHRLSWANLQDVIAK